MFWYRQKKPQISLRLKGGDYLLFRFRSTIGVIRFNFSVRNGKRWSPYAVFALISSFTALSPCGGFQNGPDRKLRRLVLLLVPRASKCGVAFSGTAGN